MLAIAALILAQLAQLDHDDERRRAATAVCVVLATGLAIGSVLGVAPWGLVLVTFFVAAASVAARAIIAWRERTGPVTCKLRMPGPLRSE